MVVPNKIENRSEGEGEKKGKKKEWEKERKKNSSIPSDSPSVVRCCAVLSMRPQSPTRRILQYTYKYETRQWKCSLRGVSSLPPDRLLPFFPFFFSLFRAPLLVPYGTRNTCASRNLSLESGVISAKVEANTCNEVLEIRAVLCCGFFLLSSFLLLLLPARDRQGDRISKLQHWLCSI